jgi:hypothetical protein
MKILIKDSATGLIQIREVWQRMKQALDSGVPLVIEITRENRSLPQNALIHSIISQISAQTQHLGSTWDAESWKRLLVDAYTREIGQNSGQVIPNLTGDGIVQLGLQTRKFTKHKHQSFQSG